MYSKFIIAREVTSTKCYQKARYNAKKKKKLQETPFYSMTNSGPCMKAQAEAAVFPVASRERPQNTVATSIHIDLSRKCYFIKAEYKQYYNYVNHLSRYSLDTLTNNLVNR